MAIKMKTLYITDMDGTLLTPQGRVSNKTARMINKLIDSGVLFSAATARGIESAMNILSKIRLNVPVVLLNGALIYDPAEERYLKSFSFDFNDAETVIKIFERHGEAPFMFHLLGSDICADFTELRLDVQKQFYESRKNMRYKRFRRHFRQCKKLCAENKTVVYFTNLMDYEKGQKIYDDIVASGAARPVFYKDDYSDYWFVEVFAKDAGKPEGMAFIKEYTGAERTVAFGDNLNDIAMLCAADESCAVSNARERVRQTADRVIGSNRANAVAKEITRMCKNTPLGEK